MLDQLTFYFEMSHEVKFRLITCDITETVLRKCSVKKVFFKISQSSSENACARVPFSIKLQVEASNFTKKETLAKVFSCGFCETFKNTFFIERLRWLLLTLLIQLYPSTLCYLAYFSFNGRQAKLFQIIHYPIYPQTFIRYFFRKLRSWSRAIKHSVSFQ